MCVVVGNIGRETSCVVACLFLGLVGWEARAGLWRLGTGLRGRGARRGGRVVEVVCAVVEAAERIEVAVAGIVAIVR